MKRCSTGWPTTQVIRKTYAGYLIKERYRLRARKVRLADLTTSSEMAKHVKDKKTHIGQGNHSFFNYS